MSRLVGWNGAFDGWAGGVLAGLIVASVVGLAGWFWRRWKAPSLSGTNAAQSVGSSIHVYGKVKGDVNIFTAEVPKELVRELVAELMAESGSQSGAASTEGAHSESAHESSIGFSGDLVARKDPLSKFSEEEARYVTAKAINTLPEREKVVVTLKYYEHKTEKDIAAELGLTMQQVKSAEQSALRTLAGLLRDDPQAPLM